MYGCVACRKRGLISYPEIHHIVSCHKRYGHDHTLPLCAWHHRGVPPAFEMTKKAARKLLGSSLAESKRDFTAEFGSELELLMEVNSWLNSAEKDDAPRAQEESGSFSTF
jgi:hypothetical protein